jgi:hypothetical protein
MEIRQHEVPLDGLVVVVSTSDINQIIMTPETCLFWPVGNGQESCVVETYNSWYEAVQGHVAWTADPARIARAVVEHKSEHYC